ncbi:Elongator complex protein 5 [Peziza echinospora]|nr:Elongator complex protein 5 [Peziza echinospora]
MSGKQPLSHRRTHHLLLLSRLLNSRDNASPFTLLLDTISQSSKPLVREFVRRAKLAKCTVVFVSFESIRPPWGGAATGAAAKGSPNQKFIVARGKSITELQKEIVAAVPTSGRSLIIIDSLHKLCSLHAAQISGFLSSLLTPTTSLIATYHLDIPLTPPRDSGYPDTAPHPLILLQYLSTTLITVHSMTHVLLQKYNRDKSLLPPKWGLVEDHPGGRGGGIEGAVVGLGSNSHHNAGIVLEMEHRRKSGRGVQEWFFLPTATTTQSKSAAASNTPAAGSSIFEKVGAPPGSIEKLILLEDHPTWKLSEQVRVGRNSEDEEEEGDGMPQTTFDLGLTEKQKKARDEVVLPYMDAQDDFGGGGGGGGRILYMPERVVDDWDDEEDEHEF